MKRTTNRILVLLITMCMAFSLAVYASNEPSSEAPVTKSTADMTASAYSTLTTFTDRDCTGSIFLGNDVTESADIVLNETVDGPAYTAVYAHGEGIACNVTGSVTASDDTAGEMVSDLAGQGSIIVAGEGATINLNDAVISTDGFERTTLIVGDHSTVRVENSELTARGANPLTESYEGYAIGGARMDQQIAPAWSLGIQGSSRTVNMVGDYPVLTVIDSSITSGGWALISVESSTAMSINVVDSEMSFLSENEGGMDSGWRIFGYDESAYGSGYGSFNFDYPAEYFYGTTINGATYGSVIMGSKTIRYGSSNGSLNLIDVNGEPLETVEGKGQPTVLNAVFGILHTGELLEGVYFEDGTIIHTGDAVILHKSGSGDFFFDNAELHSDKGVLFQMMDNDDDTRIPKLGGDNTRYNEDNVTSGIGFPGINYDFNVHEGGYTVSATYTNGVYEGSLYNGSGYYGHVGSNLVVTLGENAVLNGDIALTSTIKGVPYSKEAMEGIAYYGDDIGYALLDAEGNEVENEAGAAFIQTRSYSVNEYFLQGHVENLPYYNGTSTLEVVAQNGAEWNVAGQSLLTKLTIADGAAVRGTLTENADGTLTITAGDALIPAGEYGTIEPAPVDENGVSDFGESDTEAADSAGESTSEAAEDAESAGESTSEAAEDAGNSDSEGAETAEAAEDAGESNADAAEAAGESDSAPAEASAETP